MLDAMYYLGGTIAAIGAIYIAANILVFMWELPFIDRGDD